MTYKMSVYIEELRAPNLSRTKMNCDGVIDPKLEQYPMIRDSFSTTNFTVFLGPMGSGKTSLLVSLIKGVFKKCYNTIYLIMPSTSRMSLENDIFGKILPSSQIYDDLNESVLSEIFQKVEADSKEGYFSLVLIDDFQDALKTKDVEILLQKLVIKMRHLRTTTFILQQNVKSLPRSLRVLVSNYLSFNLGKSQMEDLFEESIRLPKSLFQSVMDVCFTKKYDWILINLRSNTIYSKFDMVHIIK